VARWKCIIENIPETLPGSSFHPVTEALLAARGYSDEDTRNRFLRPDFARDIHDPFLFRQMGQVVERIGRARDCDEKIGIFGDYDADGVTSSVIMREVLSALGINYAVYIPDKLSEGHGFNMKAVETFASQGVKLILTLDCGMTNHDEIHAAKERGMETIIIDHHHVPEILPEAFAIINPKLTTETYPFQELCGAGTCFKVAQALYRRFLPEQEEQLKWLLDVVATGTVADVMPLIGENRAIVKYGLIVLGKTRRVGFQEMFALGKIGVDGKQPIDARTIGFQIAPRINAASRMAHAMIAHDLLMEADPSKAQELASVLDAHNTARQKVSTATTDAVRQIAIEKYGNRKFIFAVDEAYPFGIVGLVAGRIANEFRKPTCVLTRGAETSHGSFRSVPEVNIIELIEMCSDMLVTFGGHSQAAGMTIRNDMLEAFYERFDALVSERLSGIATEPELLIDARIRPEHVTPALYRDIMLFAPFGEGNAEPAFLLEGLVVRSSRTVGNGAKHLKLALESADASKRFDAIGFSLGGAFGDVVDGDVLDAVFQLSENTWNGSTTIQLKLLDLKRQN
jgi:single-stranded-DNA-specific exonuclease